MLAELRAPGVYVERVEPVPGLDPVAVDVPAFIAVCERGPVDLPVRVTSWPAFESIFGSFVANGIGAYAVKGFFDNGGRVAHVVRVAAPVRTAALSGPQPPDRRASVLTSTAGMVVGAAVAITQASRTWLYLVAEVNSVTNKVTWDRALPPDPDLDLTLPVVFATGADAATTDLIDDAGLLALRVTANTPGAWGNWLSISVRPSFDAATVNDTSVTASTAATPVASVDGFTPSTLVRISQDLGGIVTTTVAVVTAVDAGSRVLTWDVPLPGIDPTKTFRIEAESFTLSVRERGRLREVHSRISLVPGNDRFAPEILKSSGFVRCEVLGPPPAVGHPAVADAVRLNGGRDGTAAMDIDDVLGDELVEQFRGLACLALDDEPALVCAPDLVAESVPARISRPPIVEVDPCWPCPPPPLSPDLLVATISEASAAFDDAVISTAQQAMIDHCERRGDRIAVLDPPAGQKRLETPALISWRRRFDSTYAAMYAPWLIVLDPLADRPGGPLPWGRHRRIPPSGHLSGCIARVDAEVGPWAAPANRVLRWAQATDVVIDEERHALLNEAGVNALRAEPSRGVVVLGARIIAADASWRYLNVRRLFLMIERTLNVGLAWVVFEPAGPALDRTMSVAITGLLEDLVERGAFAQERAEDAFFVRPGGGDRLRGEVIVEVGIAAARPTEVILLQVVRTENRLEIRERPTGGV